MPNSLDAFVFFAWVRYKDSQPARPHERPLMTDFGPAAILGLCFGFLWGIGCSLAILYAIYLGGYRKAVEDSLGGNAEHH